MGDHFANLCPAATFWVSLLKSVKALEHAGESPEATNVGRINAQELRHPLDDPLAIWLLLVGGAELVIEQVAQPVPRLQTRALMPPPG